jgi:hypothetical protein
LHPASLKIPISMFGSGAGSGSGVGSGSGGGGDEPPDPPELGGITGAGGGAGRTTIPDVGTRSVVCKTPKTEIVPTVNIINKIKVIFLVFTIMIGYTFIKSIKKREHIFNTLFIYSLFSGYS